MGRLPARVQLEPAQAGDDSENIVGFQTVNLDGLCVAIEVIDDFLGRGVATQLVEGSGCWEPEDDCCPEFLEKNG